MENTSHFNKMLKERGISREWVDITLDNPDKIENREDGTHHYLKQIPDCGNRWLRVVVNVVEEPSKMVTVFFDRRLRKEK